VVSRTLWTRLRNNPQELQNFFVSGLYQFVFISFDEFSFSFDEFSNRSKALRTLAVTTVTTVTTPSHLMSSHSHLMSSQRRIFLGFAWKDAGGPPTGVATLATLATLRSASDVRDVIQT